MRKNNREETQESGKVLALTVVLMNILILTVVVGMFWLMQIVISQSDQFNDLARGFNLM